MSTHAEAVTAHHQTCLAEHAWDIPEALAHCSCPKLWPRKVCTECWNMPHQHRRTCSRHPKASERKCFSCQEIKRIEDFTSDPVRAEGRSYRCKACARAYQRHRSLEPEYKRRHGLRSMEWAKRNPDKARAHSAVKAAVKSGRLVRSGRCEDCGHERSTVAHHEDYSRPLDVNWLCLECHTRRHHAS